MVINMSEVYRYVACCVLFEIPLASSPSLFGSFRNDRWNALWTLPSWTPSQRIIQVRRNPLSHSLHRFEWHHVPFYLVWHALGQVNYMLLQEREKRGIKDIAISHIEQISPFPYDIVSNHFCWGTTTLINPSQITPHLDKYPNADLLWCQVSILVMSMYCSL